MPMIVLTMPPERMRELRLRLRFPLAYMFLDTWDTELSRGQA
jgi:hypothetical protein